MSFDVRRWLESSGFGQYAGVFQAHRIDIEALAALTEQRLGELGIPSALRLKVLDASAQAPRPLTPRSAAAERRRLTVMFVDLVGSTKLAGRLDPEELGSVLGGYQEVVYRAVKRYEGYIAKYIGDGVMLYFGYPNAHEDDAERAVRAALAIRADIAEVAVPGGGELVARISVATGLVVVGGMLGAGSAREHEVIGQTPNIAARLQDMAGPREILIGDRTRELIGSRFELRDLGNHDLKDVDEPVRVYSVIGERAVESRFEAQRTSELVPMVGRDFELMQLSDRWREACSGNGRVVLVTGEAGIGKSRLVRALRDTLSVEPHVPLLHQCSPHHTESALFPAIQQLTRAARISPNDSAKMRLDRLQVLLAGTPAEDMALIAALLGVDGAKRYGALDLTPPQQRLRTFDALINQLVRLAQLRPVLWVLEDAHWIDPSTLELVQRCIGRVAGIRLLAIITARPDFAHNFGAHPHVTRVALNRLGPVDTTAMVGGLTRGKPLPAHLLAEIVSKTDGVPLFIEEFTKSMIESGFLRETENSFVVNTALQLISVPASLHDSLMARLDRLRPYKNVAQTASCIGREFSYGLLCDVCETPEPVLRDSLARLVDAELIYQRGSVGEPQYAFKHALVRDAAYESLLRTKREQIHARLVEALERLPGTAPEVIAQHAALAHLNEKAIDCWQKAAAHAFARPAYREAIAHLTQAIHLAEAMGDSLEWRERRLLLWMALGQAAMPLYGYSHAQTVSIFKQARELAIAMGGGPHGFSILYATWVTHYVGGEQERALQTAHSMLKAAESDRNEEHRLAGLRALGISQMITGQPAFARDTFEQAKQLADALPRRSRERRLAVADRLAADPEIATQFHVSLTLWSLGRIDEARALAAEAVAAARAMGHAHTLGHAVTHGAIFAVVCRDADQALELSAESMEFAEKHDMELWKGYGSILHGFALALKCDAQGSLPFMKAGFASITRTQTGAMVPLHRAMHARTLASLGHFDDAQRCASAVREELRYGSERYFWPECQRLLGDYLRLCPEASKEEVGAAYTGAYVLAREQGVMSWELYAATSLARWWAERGERARAGDLLGPLCERFTQGLDSPGYLEATTLLETLKD